MVSGVPLRVIAKLRNYLIRPELGPTLLRAVTGSAGLRVAGMGFTFLVGVQLARGLGAEGYGIYGIVMSIVSLLMVPTEFGLPYLLTREIASAQVKRDWGRMKGVLQWSYRFSLAIAVAVVFAAIAWLFLSGKGLSSSLGITLLVGVAMVPITAQLNLCSAALRGLQRIVASQVPNLLVRPMLYSFLLFVAPLGLLPLNPAVAMGLGVASVALPLVMAWRMLRRAMPVEIGTATPIIDARSWRSNALPMAMTEGMRILQAHLLILMLGWMVPMADVGIYRVATSVMLLIAMPVSLFNVVSMPIIARLHASRDKERLQRLLSVTSLGMTFGLIMLALPFLFAGETILASVFGEEFGASQSVLIVMCIGTLASAALGVNAAVLNMTGHQGKVTRASAVGLLVLLAISIPLIDAFGIFGAAVSNILSILVWSIIMWRDCIRLEHLDTSLWALLAARKL